VGGKCFAKDLYIPRCLPDGDMVVHSGHFLKPWIKALGLRGCVLLLVGGTLDFMWHNKSLVYLSIGSLSIATVPLRTC